MKKRPSLLWNSLSQVGVRLVGSACALVLTWMIARRSVADLGVFRTLFVYFLMCEFVPLLGLQTFLFREISLHPHKIRSYCLHALIFSLGVSALAIVLLGILAASGAYSPAIARGLLIVAAGFPATAASIVGLSVLVGAGRATRFSLVQGLETVARTLIGIVLVWFGWGVLPVIAAMIAVRWCVVLGYWQAIRPLLDGDPWRFDRSFFLELLRQVPTFAGITLLSIVMRFAAPAMLPWLLNDSAAGQFAAAYVFIDLTLLVPTALTTNLVPVLAHKARENPAALAEACRQGIKIMAIGVFPVCAVIAAIAGPMFASLLPGNPSYAASARILEVIIWVCSLQAIDQVLSAAIVARHRQDLDLRTLLIGSAILVALLSVSIPAFGVLGAAAGLLAGLACSLVVRVIIVGRHIRGLQLFELIWRPAAAAVVSLATATALARYSWIVGGAAGGLSYLAAFTCLGGFAKREREGLVALLQPGRA